MAPTAEIAVIGLAPSDKAATSVFQRLRALGADVARVSHSEGDVATAAAAVRSALQRRPGLLFVLGADESVLGAAVAAGAERPVAGEVPAGAVPLEGRLGFTLLVGATYVVGLAGGLEALEEAWRGELGACLAEWLGQPVHVRGELVVLDGGAAAVEQLMALVAAQHADVYLRAEPADGAGIRVCALVPAAVPHGSELVDLALAAMERAAGASRLRVASTGRRPGTIAGPPLGI